MAKRGPVRMATLNAWFVQECLSKVPGGMQPLQFIQRRLMYSSMNSTTPFGCTHANVISSRV